MSDSLKEEGIECEPEDIMAEACYAKNITISHDGHTPYATLLGKHPREFATSTSTSVSNTNDSYENENAATVNSIGNIFFPVVNRIMMQIKNKDDNKYYLWGDVTSQISNDVLDLSSGRIICRKHFPIPPIKSTSIHWESSQNGGREKRVYELKDFANSITLYSEGNRADEADI